MRPQFCKFCKRLSCKQCIDKWLLTHSFCGICKSKISHQDIIVLPVLGGLDQLFYNLQNNNVSNNNFFNNNNNTEVKKLKEEINNPLIKDLMN